MLIASIRFRIDTMDGSAVVIIFGFLISLFIMYFAIKTAVESAIRDALRENNLSHSNLNTLDNTPKHSSHGTGSATMLLTSPTRVVDRGNFDHFFVTIGDIKTRCDLNERLQISLNPGSYNLEFKQIAADGRPSYVASKTIIVSDSTNVYIMTNPDRYVIYQSND